MPDSIERYPERGAAKLAPLRGAQTDAAPFPAPGIADTARSTGLHCNGHFKSNRNDNGHFRGNRNGRCAYVQSNGRRNVNGAGSASLRRRQGEPDPAPTAYLPLHMASSHLKDRY